MGRNIFIGTMVFTALLLYQTPYARDSKFPLLQNAPRDTSARPAQIYSPGIWFSGEVGAGNYVFSKIELSAATEDNFEFQLQVLAAASTNQITLDFFGPPQSSTNFLAPGILIGRRFVYPGYFFSFETGVSYLWGTNDIVTVTGNDCGWFGGTGECIDSKEESINTIGVPIEFDFCSCSQSVGVGMEIYANLNKVKPLVGIALSIPFGWIY